MNSSRAEQTLFDLLALPGPSGRERPVADDIRRRLLAAGCHESWILEDDAHTRIPGDYEMGNLIVKLPGTLPDKPRILFAGHMDTVPLVRGAVPKREGRRFVPSGKTALGADNRTACAAIVTLAETLLQKKLPHPPITLLFCVGEETGLWGARMVDPKDLGYPVMGFNIDSGEPDKVVIGAIGAHRWRAEISGVAAHAGVHPERGISAALIASRAITAIAAKGFFGLIHIGDKRGTSNVGVIQGGEATNQVMDALEIKGESRSHDPVFLEEITQTIEQCFHEAAASVSNVQGHRGSVAFFRQQDYPAFRMKADSPVVHATAKALKSVGLTLTTEITNGGLDANFLNRHTPTVTLGAGQHNPHTIEEYADLDEYLTCCRLLLQLTADACA